MNEDNKIMEANLKPVQRASLEILKKADEICLKNSINYTLLYHALWGAVEYQGFTPWEPQLKIGMFYQDFLRFINICKNEFEGTNYYIIDGDNCEQFEELYIRIAKRSRVKLPQSRKKDEKYYDYTLDVFPIYYAGNTKDELKAMQKEQWFLYKCIHTNKPAHDSTRVSNIIKRVKQAYYYKHKTVDTYEKLKALMIKYNTPTKYVMIPYFKDLKDSICLADTYTNIQDCLFEGYNFKVIKNAKEWLLDFYGLKKMAEIKNTPVNQAVLEGPEILRRVQLIELEILEQLDRICRKYNIKYNLGAGTLLGAIRHGGIIPWDDDIDVFMLYDDYKLFLEVAKRELDSEKYFLKTQETDKDCNLTFAQIKRNNTKYSKGRREEYNTHPGILIDIFPFFNGPKTSVVHYLQHKICKFFKTMTWAHMGANSERNILKRQYYHLLALVSNKKSYNIFMKFACMVKKSSDRLSYFYIFRNYQRNPVNKRKSHENLITVEFEGHSFLAAEDWNVILKYLYSDEYMRYPSVGNRKPKHLPAIIDVGELYNNYHE